MDKPIIDPYDIAVPVNNKSRVLMDITLHNFAVTPQAERPNNTDSFIIDNFAHKYRS
jgi:hypothetical protein